MPAVGDLVHQATTTSGTGPYTLTTVGGKQAFADAFGIGGADVFFVYISNRSAAEWMYGSAHMDDASTLVVDTVLGGTNGTSPVNFSAGPKDVANDLPANIQASALNAYGLAASVGANALTISVKGIDGADASSVNPLRFDFRSATASAGVPVRRYATAALSLTISSGSTLGASNGIPFRLWIVLFDDGGTLRLGAIKCTLATGFYALSEWALGSSTAEGGAGGADSAGVFYTNAAVAAKPYKILGFMDWDSGLTTAGAWASGPSRVQLYERGMPLPGQEIGNSTRGIRTTQDSFTSTSYVDTNLTAGMTLRSPCNAVAGVAIGALAVGTSTAGATVAVRRGGAVVNLSQSFYGAVANFNAVSVIPILDFPGATGPHTYTVAVKSSTGTVYYPGATTTESGATISLSEVMG